MNVAERPQIDGITLHPEPPTAIIDEWQEITNLLAEAMGVEAALVMRGNADTMEVMAASELQATPYSRGELAPREGKLYCETVIASQRPLIVEDAFSDPVWKGNPDTALGLASYYGLPVNWPDGGSFGTICVLAKRPMVPRAFHKKLMKRLQSVVELTLELLVTQQQLNFSATHDALTGVLDRDAFMEIASQYVTDEIAKTQSSWIIFWDIDEFKKVNDRLGHAMGDEVLKEVAHRAESVLRATDYLGRLGGDEFAVVVTRATDSDVESLASRLLEAVKGIPIHDPEGWGTITVSLGVTPLSEGDTLDSWLARADELMYRAKHEGKNRYAFA